MLFDNLDGTPSTRRIDLYKRGCFVLESKQGVVQHDDAPLLSAAAGAARNAKGDTARAARQAWDDAMFRARGQAEQYARALPADEGRPPFLVVVDVGHSIELYAEFSQTGGTYVAVSRPASHRIRLADLADAESPRAAARRSGPIRSRSTPPAARPASPARSPPSSPSWPSRSKRPATTQTTWPSS